MRISRVGYTRCSGCLSHVKVVDGTTECPFCGEALAAKEVLGGRTMERLRNSRAMLVAMGLAGGVTFAVACGDEDKRDDKSNTYYPDPGNDYGGFDGETNNNGVYEPEDAGTDMGTTDVGSSDAGDSDAGGSDAGDPDAGDAGADQG